ncbi:hypothetical protein NQ036_03865 [Brevibacterium sp. 91QC2O2]|uniref:hypothetical protein n=1 Tax=Brevibacterium TaxID=1696 RepID=UPI00211CD148|nr:MULTISPECIES: hypothetical protein [unclassified Brevibacterium]MCQ9367384.1 hypothetical protein [Brevibacterium sp. 91QC2O2]MCQ9384603.1 hypothetical protein [Brevibacterium sp. 68QC2CO]
MTDIDREDLTSTLKNGAWTLIGRGPAGELWRNSQSEAEVGIPYDVRPSTSAWSDVLIRVAAADKISVPDLSKTLISNRFDVSEFRAAGTSWSRSVPVDTGYNLFKTARQVLRASATTSRNQTAQINGNYSTAGDVLLSQSRFGQTREGSYIVPLLVPVVSPAPSTTEQVDELKQDDEVFGKTAHGESVGRRATRMMAQSLDALYREVIEPAVVPGKELVNHLVMLGISREFISAVESTISESMVDRLDVDFQWSPRGGDLPKSIEHHFSIESEAAELLERTAKRFVRPPKHDLETFTGPIVQLRDEESTSYADLTIDTTRRNRSVELSVRVSTRDGAAVHDWFKQRETVIVQGLVRTQSGRLRIDSPKSIGLAKDTVLPTE